MYGSRIINKKNMVGVSALMIGVRWGSLDSVKELNMVEDWDPEIVETRAGRIELETNGRREELLSGAPSMRNPQPDKDGTNLPESLE